MKIIIDKLGEVRFEKILARSHFGIEVYGREAFCRIQNYSMFEVTSAAFIKSSLGWTLVAVLDVPEYLSILCDDDYIADVTDEKSIQKLNAFLYDS